MADDERLETLMKEMTAIKKMVTDLHKGGGTAKPKKKKDPNAPKRPLNAYFVYQKDARPKIRRLLRRNQKVRCQMQMLTTL